MNFLGNYSSAHARISHYWIFTLCKTHMNPSWCLFFLISSANPGNDTSTSLFSKSTLPLHSPLPFCMGRWTKVSSLLFPLTDTSFRFVFRSFFSSSHLPIHERKFLSCRLHFNCNSNALPGVRVSFIIFTWSNHCILLSSSSINRF
jgi:hypothetical protein